MATEVLIRERKSVKHGKTYEYRFETASIGGKRQWISKSGFLTAKEAKTAGIAALNEYNNCGNVAFDSNISFADFLDIWLEEECKTTLKSITMASYQKKIKNHIIPALGKYALKNIKRTDLQNFLNKMHDNGYSKNSIVEIKGILTKCLSCSLFGCYLIVIPFMFFLMLSIIFEEITLRNFSLWNISPISSKATETTSCISHSIAPISRSAASFHCLAHISSTSGGTVCIMICCANLIVFNR